MVDGEANFYERWHTEQMQDPEFSREYRAVRAQIDQVDAIIRQLDELRAEMGMSKAQLARRIGKNPAVVRRLFTAQVNPELKTVAAIADALDAEITLKPRETDSRSSRQPSDVA